MEKIIAKNLDIIIDLITDESNFINDLGNQITKEGTDNLSG